MKIKCLVIASSILISPLQLNAGVLGIFDKLSEFWEGDIYEQIIVSVSHNEDRCSSEQPLLISIQNNSSRDITDLKIMAYSTEEGFSRAVCAEPYGMSDRIFRAGEESSFCFSTIGSKGVFYNNFRISNEMIEDNNTMNPVEYSQKYGFEAERNFRGFVSEKIRVYQALTQSVDPKQSLGCRYALDNLTWHGVAQSLEVLSESQ